MDMTPEKIDKAPSASPAVPSDAESVDLSSEIANELKELVPESAERATSRASGKSPVRKSKAKATAVKREERRQMLINSKPSTKVMISDIQQAVRGKLNKLEKKESKLKSQGPKSYYKYNQVVCQVRSLKKMFAGLFYKTYEELKAIWLKVVHDIV